MQTTTAGPCYTTITITILTTTVTTIVIITTTKTLSVYMCSSACATAGPYSIVVGMLVQDFGH